ncbi:hypothetical protein [Streptomyces niveus]|uniref:hypothetical protein n=1 Tax=Streptomyces niveus TaxID=193462 RepID=UPI00364CEDDC
MRNRFLPAVIDLLSACDRRAPVRLAMNPFFPVAHPLTQAVHAEEKGQPVVYLAESQDPGSQMGSLPPEVDVALSRQGLVQAPPRRAHRSAHRVDGQ